MGPFSKLIVTCLFLGFAGNSLAYKCSNWGLYEISANSASWDSAPPVNTKGCPNSHPVCPHLCGECMTYSEWYENETTWHYMKCSVVRHGKLAFNLGKELGEWLGGRKKRSSDPNCLEQISNSKSPLDLQSECKELFLKTQQRMEKILENTEKRVSLLKQLEDLD